MILTQGNNYSENKFATHNIIILYLVVFLVCSLGYLMALLKYLLSVIILIDDGFQNIERETTGKERAIVFG